VLADAKGLVSCCWCGNRGEGDVQSFKVVVDVHDGTIDLRVEWVMGNQWIKKVRGQNRGRSPQFQGDRRILSVSFLNSLGNFVFSWFALKFWPSGVEINEEPIKGNYFSVFWYLGWKLLERCIPLKQLPMCELLF
jgi:hypothetical protein